MTTITLHDGIAWFEDGTSVEGVTADGVKALPQLLAACLKMRGRLTTLANDDDYCWLDWPDAYDVDAAIAKATGQTDRDRFESGETFVVWGEQCHGMAGIRAHDADRIFDDDGGITPDFEQFDIDRETADSISRKGDSFWWKVQAILAAELGDDEQDNLIQPASHTLQ